MYKNFANIYDGLQKDIDYEGIVNYIEEVFAKFNIKPSLVLDLACGTGNVTIPLAERGYDMIGLDSSIDMLNIASNKAKEKGHDILFLHQDMTDFELYGTVDAIVCILDSVNYITDKRKLNRFFKLCNNYLNHNGVVIFDINTLYKFKEILGNNIFVNDTDDIYYIWQNNFDAISNICEFELTFFCKNVDGYTRFDEFHEERAYSSKEITLALSGAKLDGVGCFEGFSFKKPKTISERLLFIAKKN